MLKVPVLALIIETSTVWPWYRRSFQGICRGLWIIIAELPAAYFPWSFALCSPHEQEWSTWKSEKIVFWETFGNQIECGRKRKHFQARQFELSPAHVTSVSQWDSRMLTWWGTMHLYVIHQFYLHYFEHAQSMNTTITRDTWETNRTSNTESPRSNRHSFRKCPLAFLTNWVSCKAN
jgi:hypothetical protein